MEKKNGNHTFAFVLLWFCISSCFVSCWMLSNKIQEQNYNVAKLSRLEYAISNYILTRNKSSVENALYDIGIHFNVMSELRLDGKFNLFVAEKCDWEPNLNECIKGKCIGTFNPENQRIDLKDDCKRISNN